MKESRATDGQDGVGVSAVASVIFASSIPESKSTKCNDSTMKKTTGRNLALIAYFVVILAAPPYTVIATTTSGSDWV